MSEHHHLSRRYLVIGGTATIGSLVTARLAGAQDASPAAEEGGGMPPLPPGATVAAEGLWNPGNLTFGPDGALYIAESGVAGGGDGPGMMATPMPDGALPPGAAPLVPPQVSMVAPDGTQMVLTTETGGIGIGFFNDSVFVSTGGSSVGSGFAPLPEENRVTAVDIATAEVRTVAELGQFEVDNNPDGLDVNPNLYGLGINSSGMIYVADAGGNSIYAVDSVSGEFSLFAVLPNLTELTGATPTAEESEMQPGPRQPVPTSVVVDGADHVTVVLLSEAWNGPSVFTYAPDGTYVVGSAVLSMIVSAALGPDGLLYVSQLTADFSSEMPAPGNVLRINADATVEPVVEGLFFPHGIAFDANGNLFVATNSIISGPDAPLGMVLRFDGIATPAA
ncbi:MAG TPA: ScyD/ScyE family protein [Thermomicrobiales bacterium]|nr:ScyD/ScyE family protein [Thermomicrobiales bacterium]